MMRILFSLLLMTCGLANWSHGAPKQRTCKEIHAEAKPKVRDRKNKTPDFALRSRLYDGFLTEATEFLITHLRWPNREESQDLFFSHIRKRKLEGEVKDLSLEDILVDHRDQLMQDFREKRMDRYLFLRRKIAAAFAAAVRQNRIEPRFRTVGRTPSTKLLFLSLITGKANGGPKLLADYMKGTLTEGHLRALLGEKSETGDFLPAPVLFPEGLKEVESVARLDSPATFRTYQDTRIVNSERAERTVKALEETRGFVAISWTSGKPVEESFLQSLLAYVEARDFVLLVGPTRQIYEGLPEILLNHPRVHIVTHTIENKFLKISNLPINPDIENPLQVVGKPGQFEIGQTVVVFHPHTMIASVPTDANTYSPTTLISTGGLNVPLGSYSAVSSGSRATTAKNFYKLRAVVFEKGDRESGMDPDGLQNVWHYRPISYFNDAASNGTKGFIDWHQGYLHRQQADGSFRLEKIEIFPEYIFLGDPHERLSDPRFVHALATELGIPAEHRFSILGGDLFDGGSINHWNFGKDVTLNKQFKVGALDLQREVNDVIQYVNAIQQRFPNARYIQKVGNHDEWLSRLLDQPPDFHRVINGDFIDELAFAVKTLNMNVWEYIFKRRAQFLSTLLDVAPEKRKEILNRITPIHDAGRIDILDRDEPLIVGPAHRQNVLHRHGDERVNGRRATNRDLMLGARGGVSGHNHLMLMFDEWGSAGVSATVEQDYTRGNLSSQGQGFWFIYGNGTKQMITFDRLSGTFRQRPDGEVLPPDRFFGDNPFQVKANDNDLVPRDEAERQIEIQLEQLRGASTK